MTDLDDNSRPEGDFELREVPVIDPLNETLIVILLAIFDLQHHHSCHGHQDFCKDKKDTHNMLSHNIYRYHDNDKTSLEASGLVKLT